MTDLGQLDPRTFENLIYDLVSSAGFSNVVWRTPGSDGGRDIEAQFSHHDAVGEHVHQKWYIECKRYRSSVDWPTVYNKVAYAESNGADFLLIATNSNPSPNCETQIQAWNASKALKIRFWRGYQLESKLRQHAQIAVKYGLAESAEAQHLAFQPLLFEIAKIVQAANASLFTGSSPQFGLTAAAAIGELLQQRIGDLTAYGAPSFISSWSSAPEAWLSMPSVPARAEEIGLTAFSSTLRYVTAAAAISVSPEGDTWKIQASEPRLALSQSGISLLRMVAEWTNIEIYGADRDRLLVNFRG